MMAEEEGTKKRKEKGKERRAREREGRGRLCEQAKERMIVSEEQLPPS